MRRSPTRCSIPTAARRRRGGRRRRRAAPADRCNCRRRHGSSAPCRAASQTSVMRGAVSVSVAAPFAATCRTGRSPRWPSPCGPACVPVCSGSKCPPAAPAGTVVAVGRRGLARAVFMNVKPVRAGGRPLRSVLTSAPCALSAIVTVPTASPGPDGVARCISARSSAAAAAPAPAIQASATIPSFQTRIAVSPSADRRLAKLCEPGWRPSTARQVFCRMRTVLRERR